MKLRCLLRGHSWGPPEGVSQYPVHTCTQCGKTKKLSSVPQPWDAAPPGDGGGYGGGPG
jgi:hypothetical protein